jgi:uncharacterized protein VirK/YbjX
LKLTRAPDNTIGSARRFIDSIYNKKEGLKLFEENYQFIEKTNNEAE